MRRLGHKPILAITAMVAAVTAVTFAASPAVQADIETHSDSVDITSLPGSAPVVLDQFDPSLGTLTQLTVTATLAGSITAMVENLSSVVSSSTLAFTASADAVGPGSVALHVSIADGASQTLTPLVPTPYNLADNGQQVVVITDPAVLALFSGTGTVTFDVSGIVRTTIDGPANWRTCGVGSAIATVSVDYDFGPCVETTTRTRRARPPQNPSRRRPPVRPRPTARRTITSTTSLRDDDHRETTIPTTVDPDQTTRPARRRPSTTVPARRRPPRPRRPTTGSTMTTTTGDDDPGDHDRRRPETTIPRDHDPGDHDPGDDDDDDPGDHDHDDHVTTTTTTST